MKTLRLTARQRRQLEKQLKNSRDVRLYRRTLTVLEYDRGRSVTEISRTLHVSRPSIYRWIERYRESSHPESLRDDDRSGRPPSWTEECSEWLQGFLKRSPAELGYFAVNWTIPLLRDPLEMCTGKRFSDDTIRRALRRQDYVWKRPRYVLAPDPEREKKTPNSPQNPAFAASKCAAGGRRDRFASFSAVARQLGATRPANPRADLGKERASCCLRCDEPSNRKATVSCSSASAATGLSSFSEVDPPTLPWSAHRPSLGCEPEPHRGSVTTARQRFADRVAVAAKTGTRTQPDGRTMGTSQGHHQRQPAVPDH